MFTPQDIDALITTLNEHERLEFKEAKQQYSFEKLCKYSVALANEGGGRLLLGVSDKNPRRVVGSAAFSDIRKTKEQIFSKLNFRIEADEVSHPDGRVLIFSIPSRPTGTAYAFEGAYLMRMGGNLVPMTEDTLRRIFAEGKGDFLLRPIRTDLTPDEVISLLDTQSFFELLKRPYPATRESVLERLLEEQLISKNSPTWSITNLGALLFAKNLQDFGILKRKGARIIRYNGTSKIETLRDIIITKGYAAGFETLIQSINGQLPANEAIGEALRTEIRMYPEIAIRELVANALVHQDLEDTSSFVMIEIYADRLEIANPGKPLIVRIDLLMSISHATSK